MRPFFVFGFAVMLLASLAAGPATKPAPFTAFRGGGGLIGEVEGFAPPRLHPDAPSNPTGPAIEAPALKLRWTYHAGTETEHASIESAAAAITPDAVYIADDRGTLHAIDLATGKGKWKYVSDGGFDTSPMVMNGRVYLGDLSGIMHCVSAADGKKVWTLDTESGIHSSCNSDGTHILFGNDGAEIFCLNADDGTKVWTAAAEDRINSAPSIGTIAGGKTAALVSGCDGQLRAIELVGGKELFAADMGTLAPGSPAIVKDRILVGTDHGHVLCFSNEGKLLWDYDKVEDNAMVATSPAVSDGIVVAGAQDRKVHAIDLATGAQRWVFATRGEVDSSPLISEGRVYFGSKDKKLYALDLKSGKKLWEFTASRAISAPPAIGEGVLVIGDNRGNVYCFESE